MTNKVNPMSKTNLNLIKKDVKKIKKLAPHAPVNIKDAILEGRSGAMKYESKWMEAAQHLMVDNSVDFCSHLASSAIVKSSDWEQYILDAVSKIYYNVELAVNLQKAAVKHGVTMDTCNFSTNETITADFILSDISVVISGEFIPSSKNVTMSVFEEFYGVSLETISSDPDEVMKFIKRAHQEIKAGIYSS